MSLVITPCSIGDARTFVAQHHRHRNRGPTGAKFAIAVSEGRVVRGVAIAGRMLQDGWTIEITRVCTDGAPNACSMLYAACRRIALGMGYRRVITYTLQSEPGSSCRAAGFRVVADVRGGKSWDTPARPRAPGDQQAKFRWEFT